MMSKQNVTLAISKANVIHPKHPFDYFPFSLFLFLLLSFILYCNFSSSTTYETIYVFWSIARPTCARGALCKSHCRGTRRGSSLPPSQYFFRATLFQPFPISDSNRKIVSCLIVKLMAAPRVRRGAHCNFEISSQINFPSGTKLVRVYTHSLVDSKFVIVCSDDIGSKIF